MSYLCQSNINTNNYKQLYKMAKVSIKEVINSDNWIITSIMQGLNGVIRIDARTRNRVADGINHYSEWCTKIYADRLLMEKYGKKHNEFNCYKY